KAACDRGRGWHAGRPYHHVGGGAGPADTVSCPRGRPAIRIGSSGRRRCRNRNMRPYRNDMIARCTLLAVLALATLDFAAAQNAGAVVGTATLPRDLTPWGLYRDANPVVKAVLIRLAVASMVTWTVWLTKTVDIVWSRRQIGVALR